MNRKDLIKKMAEKTGFKKKDVELVLKTFTETVGESLASGDKVQLTGFGTFGVRDSKPRVGRNPQTGEKIKIKARKSPYLRVGKGLKEVVQPKVVVAKKAAPKKKGK
ncbi:MAG: HU family DNA-binding protein [Firmicutes bacterium]|nr:HU family DNA-binding protein [Bacillota bacterium]